MAEALTKVIRFGFNTLRINPIEAEAMTGDQSSEKPLEKARFQKEGILKE